MSGEIIQNDDYRITCGDAVRLLWQEPGQSIDLAVFSPPFASLYAYSSSEADMGNSRESDDEFLHHFDHFCAALAPRIKPGRNVCVHLQQVARSKVHHGYIGLFDLRGAVIRSMEAAGLHFYGEAAIDKDPQAQAIRTKAMTLQFQQLHKDSAWSRPALADWLVIFKAPGQNEAKIKPDVTNEEWIEWARPIWTGIRETDVLNVEAARSSEDERHVCPLQLGFIERCVRLWSAPGERVLSPFAGVGSEGYVSLLHHRKFLGFELNPRYFEVARKNLDRALEERKERQVGLFANGGVA
jgi:DNA modification methylase